MNRTAELLMHGLRYFWHKYLLGYHFFGSKVAIDEHVKVYNPRNIALGNHVHLQEGVWLNVIEPRPKPILLIGDGCDIGRNCFLTAKQSIVLEDHVLLAPNVFVSDHSHRTDILDSPIMVSGVTTPRPVVIGQGSWIGINSVILPGVRIGRHAVIGANSVVTSNVPDYAVAVGAPAKIVKLLKPTESTKKLSH